MVRRMLEFDVVQVPFSRFGAYLAYSRFDHSLPIALPDMPPGGYLRSVHDGAVQNPLFRVEVLVHGASVPFNEMATPERLQLRADEGMMELCLAEPHILRLRGQGVGLRLSLPRPSRYDTALPIDPHSWRLNLSGHFIQFLLTAMSGSLAVSAPWEVDHCTAIVAELWPDPQTGTFEAALEEYRSGGLPSLYDEPFETCCQRVATEFQSWLMRATPAPTEFATARELASYINWASCVAPTGNLTRPAMYMSKNWMCSVFSWDHCFNAIALAESDPVLAWDQFMLPFDYQDDTGALPDLVNDRVQVWNFCKPPIHGWTVRQLQARNAWFNLDKVAEIYQPLSRWTDWWFTYHDDDHDGLPHYLHGNDSGWDNSTLFRDGVPVAAPDLAAYLVIQQDVLADMARQLGDLAAAATWQARSDALLERMLAKFWREDHFVAWHVGKHEPITADSLQCYLPIVLGRRLPAHISSALVQELQVPGAFHTAFGLATERQHSADYTSDGYWRGPIWAPTTLLIFDGLLQIGADDFAHTIAQQFCRMVVTNGMAENFDAQSGVGLRDPAYTWTASVFSILAHHLHNQQQHH